MHWPGFYMDLYSADCCGRYIEMHLYFVNDVVFKFKLQKNELMPNIRNVSKVLCKIICLHNTEQDYLVVQKCGFQQIAFDRCKNHMAQNLILEMPC